MTAADELLAAMQETYDMLWSNYPAATRVIMAKQSLEEAITTYKAQTTQPITSQDDFNRGVEAAAQWHVSKGQSYLNAMNCGSENGDVKHLQELCDRQIAYATAIRGLKTIQHEKG